MILISIEPSTSTPTVIYVDDEPGGSPSEDYTTIQAAVDAANPEDTVFVYAGIYNEDVEITKSIRLEGEDKINTIIIGSPGGGSIYAHNADNIVIKNFTVRDGGTGISLANSNHSYIGNNQAIYNQYGIALNLVNDTVVENNNASNNTNYHGIYLYQSTNITIENNLCIDNKGDGIWLRGNSIYNVITENNLTRNEKGIKLSENSDYNKIFTNVIEFNNGSSPAASGLSIYASFGNFIYNNIILNNKYGLIWRDEVPSSYPNEISNCTIKDSLIEDITIKNTYGTLLNTTFEKNSITYLDVSSILNVKWFLHINIVDYLGNPIQDANVKIEDNINGSYNQTYITNSGGYVHWIPITEYIEQDTSGDTIGEKTYFTPHRIVVWNDTLVGYAYPEPFINESKTINIILYNGTLVEMEDNNWNMISIPRIQSDTNLDVVLQSIEGRYNSVQWYDASDINDNWKHYCNSKPPFMNDLRKLNHTMGLWIDIIDPEGTTLVIYGDKLTVNQTIPLNLGWNFVGFPSSNNKLISDSLNGIFYGNDVDAIWSYNSTTHEWIELGPSDYFEVGHGYWIHSKVEEIWEIPV